MSAFPRALRSCIAGPSSRRSVGLASRAPLIAGAQKVRSISTTQARPSEQTQTAAEPAELPRLPVPDLNETLDAYVKSLIPLLEQKVRRRSTAETCKPLTQCSTVPAS